MRLPTIAMAALVFSTPAFSKPSVEVSFPGISQLNEELAPELSQEAFHTQWCIQAIQALSDKNFEISRGQRTVSDKSTADYVYWYALWRRNPATEEQRKIIKQRVEEIYGLGHNTATPYMSSTSFIASICYASLYLDDLDDNYYPITLEELRLSGSVEGVSQKAYHTHWCYQTCLANGNRCLLYYDSGNLGEIAFDFWKDAVEKYPITPSQEAEIRSQVDHFYRYDEGSVASLIFITGMHQFLHCNVMPTGYLLPIELYKTAKE